MVISNFLKNVITIEKWGVGYLPTQQSMVVVVVDVEKVVVLINNIISIQLIIVLVFN